jgi:hypothetical protein
VVGVLHAGRNLRDSVGDARRGVEVAGLRLVFVDCGGLYSMDVDLGTNFFHSFWKVFLVRR